MSWPLIICLLIAIVIVIGGLWAVSQSGKKDKAKDPSAPQAAAGTGAEPKKKAEEDKKWGGPGILDLLPILLFIAGIAAIVVFSILLTNRGDHGAKVVRTPPPVAAPSAAPKVAPKPKTSEEPGVCSAKKIRRLNAKYPQLVVATGNQTSWIETGGCGVRFTTFHEGAQKRVPIDLDGQCAYSPAMPDQSEREGYECTGSGLRWLRIKLPKSWRGPSYVTVYPQFHK